MLTTLAYSAEGLQTLSLVLSLHVLKEHHLWRLHKDQGIDNYVIYHTEDLKGMYVFDNSP